MTNFVTIYGWVPGDKVKSPRREDGDTVVQLDHVEYLAGEVGAAIYYRPCRLDGTLAPLTSWIVPNDYMLEVIS